MGGAYDVGDVVRYSRRSQALGIDAGEYARVEHVDAKDNQLTVKTDEGHAATYDPRRLQGVRCIGRLSVPLPRVIVQMTAPDRPRDVANRELGTIERINAHGRIGVDGTRAEAHHSSHMNGGISTTATR